MTTRTLPLTDCPEDLLMAYAAIKLQVFGKPDSTLEAVHEGHRRLLARPDDDLGRDQRIHLCTVDGRLVAAARSFHRTVAGPAGRFTVLALAGVACAPAEQKQGYGREVVRAAFKRLDDAVPFCLFQTGVPGFYAKLGAREVDNPFVNSGEGERVWWNPHIMIAPGDADWPVGEIDLLGEGW